MQNPSIPIQLLLFSMPEPEGDLATIVPIAASILTPVPLWFAVAGYRIRKRCCGGGADAEGGGGDEGGSGVGDGRSGNYELKHGEFEAVDGEGEGANGEGNEGVEGPLGVEDVRVVEGAEGEERAEGTGVAEDPRGAEGAEGAEIV